MPDMNNPLEKGGFRGRVLNVPGEKNGSNTWDWEVGIYRDYYYRVFDIGMTIIGTCADKDVINIEKGKQLLLGYQSIVALTEDELRSLKAFTIYAGASMTFWRHQNFNYVKPDPAMFDHYKGLQVLVDYMLEQDDDCFICSDSSDEQSPTLPL